MIKDYLELGKIVGTHGVRGEMRLELWCDSADFAKKFKTVYLSAKGDGETKVVSCRAHGGAALIRLTGVDDMNTAETYRGRMLYIRRSDAHLPENSWFIEELIGCTVIDADDNSIVYGKITEVMSTGANDVWTVTDDKGTEYLLPAIKSVVISADVANDRVYIRPLKGIFDDAN